MKLNHKFILSLILAHGVLLFTSCEKFVDLGAPPTQVIAGDAFASDASANSVVRGLYNTVLSINLSGTSSFYTGIAADDLQYNATDPSLAEFASNSILNSNGYVANFWYTSYQLIKNTNNAISGLEASGTLSPSVKAQLLGEAKFLRAYAYFYLVNLYGDVPLQLRDDLHAFEDASLPRATTPQVYSQIISDLKDAESSMAVSYDATASPRGRANKAAARALLARVYLYQQDYQQAAELATSVLESADYGMPSPDKNFVNSSNEVILQLGNQSGVTVFGSNYITAPTAIPSYTLPEAVYQSFEAPTDLRQTNWISPKTISGKTYYAISKYKVASGTGNEYHVLLRLAEQYLIRAEARAKLNDLPAARADIDAVRSRAGLPAISSSLNQAQLLQAIETERQHEFFGEYGHRWFDLKRTGRATAVLAPLKTNWQATDVLLPIPQSQLLINTQLTQNPGYED
ncbi:RagB/SusD family nutrient uptake outer membrane protein [Sphingobacterium sp. N143]|uniref:RagB/SusD family nutrient uptake outer membrane protein n=1 Tax=Sphingobacterium sp. N143 TaxID=2746727 RepID=UPI002577B8DD|nr:RagB/SusD family nutrient uptake outer membrane protein [Sphingobacterium sp. N143]MDM1295811.1 RagB/SusD family nutrient uptake outer membrane protein [Sphingobacterium sp. N143]